MDSHGTKVELNAVSLRQAVLCPNCEVVSDSPHDTCMVCGSRSLLPLWRVLGDAQPNSLPTAHESAEHRLNAVFVLTPPMPHRLRHRRRAPRR